MITVLVISIIVILIVLALSVLTIGKGYSYKHTVDPVKPLPEDEGKKRRTRKMKKFLSQMDRNFLLTENFMKVFFILCKPEIH
ncbi:YtzI protein [[Brevibacterium] frigoritolerans]|uniref:YtzI protein n=1 Tax=Peribacillus frigoritolerans TaxID=450367 RepID=A0A941FMK3_9BACI|nr:YtzI protein [Peribacillus frigoritolerans]